MSVKIAKNKHNCQAHPYQDKTYGDGVRVMNERKPGDYRCTVCGKLEG